MSLLPYDPGPLADLCSELDEWHRLLDYRGPLPRAWAGRLRRDLEAEAVAASTRMEGRNVTVEEVRRILAGASTPKVDPEDRSLVEGYRHEFVLRRADDEAFTWDRGLIAGLHDRVTAGRYDLGAGRLRTDAPVFIVSRLTGSKCSFPLKGNVYENLSTSRAKGWRPGTLTLRWRPPGSMLRSPPSTRSKTGTVDPRGYLPLSRCTGVASGDLNPHRSRNGGEGTSTITTGYSGASARSSRRTRRPHHSSWAISRLSCTRCERWTFDSGSSSRSGPHSSRLRRRLIWILESRTRSGTASSVETSPPATTGRSPT